MTGPEEDVGYKLHQSDLAGIWTLDADPGGHRVQSRGSSKHRGWKHCFGMAIMGSVTGSRRSQDAEEE